MEANICCLVLQSPQLWLLGSFLSLLSYLIRAPGKDVKAWTSNGVISETQQGEEGSGVWVRTQCLSQHGWLSQ